MRRVNRDKNARERKAARCKSKRKHREARSENATARDQSKLKDKFGYEARAIDTRAAYGKREGRGRRRKGCETSAKQRGA